MAPLSSSPGRVDVLRQLCQHLRQKRQELLGILRALATEAPLFSHHKVLCCVPPRLPSYNRRTSDVARCPACASLLLRGGEQVFECWLCQHCDRSARDCCGPRKLLRQMRQCLCRCVELTELICPARLPGLLGVLRRMGQRCVGCHG